MKKKLLFTVLCFAALTACNNEQITIEDTGMPTTRAIVDQNRPSTSNPDLLTNWENLSEVTLSSGSIVTLPWKDGSQAFSGEGFRTDIKKEDGWDMLFHTFEKYNLDLGQNYMCFYNKLTGVLKFFYYYERSGIKNFGTQWEMRAENKTKLFDITEYLAKAANETTVANEVQFSNMMLMPNNGIESGWSGFEFEAAYCQDFKDMQFSIKASDNVITNYTIHGNENLTSLGTITTETVTTAPKKKKSIARMWGNSATNYISGLPDNSNMSSTLTNAVSSITTKGIASAIKAGIKFIFGKTTTKISTSTSKSDVNITTTGTLTLDGSGTTEGGTTGISPISFNLYNTLNPNGEASSEGHYLGTWRLKYKPQVRYSDFERAENVKYVGSSLYANIPYPEIMECNYEIEINPDLQPYITNVTHNVSYVICDTLQGEAYKNGTWEIHSHSPMLYQDEFNTFREYDPLSLQKKSIETTVSDNFNKRAALFYEWEPITSGRLIAVINVEITYNYQGKEIIVNQSRSYDVDYIEDAEHRAANRARYEQSPSAVIISDYI